MSTPSPAAFAQVLAAMSEQRAAAQAALRAAELKVQEASRREAEARYLWATSVPCPFCLVPAGVACDTDDDPLQGDPRPSPGYLSGITSADGAGGPVHRARADAAAAASGGHAPPVDDPTPGWRPSTRRDYR